jgi:hypothetical protein
VFSHLRVLVLQQLAQSLYLLLQLPLLSQQQVILGFKQLKTLLRMQQAQTVAGLRQPLPVLSRGACEHKL